MLSTWRNAGISPLRERGTSIGGRKPRRFCAAARLTFADSGPGFREDDLPYLFEPFFPGKGEEGRGLGLNIAKQLLERSRQYFLSVHRTGGVRQLPLMDGACY